MRFLSAGGLAVVVALGASLACGGDDGEAGAVPPGGGADGGDGGGGGDGGTTEGGGPSVPAPKGTLDPSFGTGGIVALPSSHSTVSSSFALRQSDGKLLLGGLINSGGFALFLARYDATDVLDTTFGTDGVAIANVDAAAETCSRAALQADGKLVVGCTGTTGSLRFDTNGALDKTYGTNGHGPAFNTSSVLILPSGKILLAGYASTAVAGVFDFAVRRLTAAGATDTTFGTNGTVTTTFGTSAVARALAIDSTARIVAVGKAGTKFALARYSADGVLDTTFGVSGTRTTGSVGPKNDDGATSVIIQADSKILVGGTPGGYSLGNDHLLARYDANGTLDPTFGTSIYGTAGVRTAIIGQETSGTFALALRPDGRVVALGARTAYLWSADFTSGTSYNAANSAGLSAVVVLPDNRLVFAGSKDSSEMANNVDYVRDLFWSRHDATVSTLQLEKVLPLNAGSEDLTGLAVAPDGKIFAAQTGSAPVAGITCLDGAGQPVASFGAAGKFLLGRYAGAYGSASLTIDGTGNLLLQDFSDIRRVTPAGVLDTTFGKNGLTQGGNYAGLSPEAAGTSLVLWTSATVYRIGTTGKFDATFNTPLPRAAGDTLTVNALVRQPDGSFVIPGSTTNNTQPQRTDSFVARLDAAGKVDTSFGVAGAFTMDLDALAHERLLGASPAPGGGVVAAGYAADLAGLQSYAPGVAAVRQAFVVRLTSAGTLDPSFGQGGFVKGVTGGYETVNAVAVQPDGKVLVAGARAGTPTQLFVARLTASGQPDPTFAQNGVFTYTAEAGGADYLSLGADGKLLVGGFLYRSATSRDAVLLRLE